jgi:alpha-L-rhamnosidase
MNPISHIILATALLLGISVLNAPAEASALRIGHLRCEYRENPLGIDTPKPRLSWWLETERRGERQTAYQVVVASSPESLDAGRYDLWDSGRVASDCSIQIEYGGKRLRSEERCCWKVRVWDGGGVRSGWSRPAIWTMGLLAPADWHAHWIAATARLSNSALPAPGPNEPGNAAVQMRREFDIHGPVRHAVAYLCGLGYSELEINGRKIGDHVLDPGFTDFSRRALYLTYDVTPELREGRNAVGILLGGGWFNLATPDLFGFEHAPWSASPRALLRLSVEYADGTRQAIVTDPTWKWATGAIRFNCVRGGETIDARKAAPGWSAPGYPDGGWSPVVQVDGPAGRLVSQQHPPIRVTASIRPTKISEPKPGVYLFDLGVNIAGWARLRTHGAAGARVTLQYNEALGADGCVDMQHTASHTHGRFQTDEFVLAGNGLETLEPRFTYHGFRYVQVTGLTEQPTPETITGRWVTTDPAPAGSFACSDERIDRLQQAIVRTLRNNMHGIPTDCPQREKMGWMDDGCVDIEMACLNLDTPNFYRKWVGDMLDAQDPNGHVPDFAPTCGWGRVRADGSPGEMADPWWGGAIVLAPWKLYLQYGDTRILREAYAGMKGYVDYLTTVSQGHLINWGLGDWLDDTAGGGARRVPVVQTSTAAYCFFANVVGRTAALLGKADEAKSYAGLADTIRAAFNKSFLDAGSGLYAHDSQSGQALPLYLDLAPRAARPAVMEQLVKSIKGPREGHVSAGIVGLLYVYHVLMEGERNDLAWRMLTQPGYPGWLYMLDHGATSLWEDWQGIASLNHPALGCMGFWLYEGLGGIRPDPSAPGFKRFFIRPYLADGLEWVRCSYDSPYGRIETRWRLKEGRLSLEVTVPANTTATIYVPTAQPYAVKESGRPASESVKPLRAEPGAALFQVGGGHYAFEAPAP